MSEFKLSKVLLECQVYTFNEAYNVGDSVEVLQDFRRWRNICR